jgi:predicted membrane protein
LSVRSKRHILTGGMILVALGVLLILNNTTEYRLNMSWPILLIVIALGTLMQQPRDIGGWIIGVVGVIFLLKETWLVNFGALAVYLLPLLLILLGINLIIKFRSRKEP